MSCSKRVSTVSGVVCNLHHVLRTIVQYTAASRDVLAFLAVIPASARSTSLTALHELLQDALWVMQDPIESKQEAMDKLWPLVWLDAIAPTAVVLVCDTIPVFLAAVAGNGPIARPFELDASEWLQLWSSKITEYVLHGQLAIRPRLAKLQSTDVRHAVDVAAVVEVVTTTHQIRSLTVDCSAGGVTLREPSWPHLPRRTQEPRA
ncbi:hypothetical protein SPRG_04554 [Saprolegnia parasitica CBS 223.65]|uniref:Uncharacterized protein n=1 Tax=Saprolegnia parasitica (strain CBS 223.65) TaxID=695850 RepID=A0A067CJG8_SAPPC|nr:hypothetical protein SPRG_04554 [Saprolegnia parasitica CBS 223.65]KDO30653.1 hypothetical protein SPRG_04554 [Saprolegnia parasitica CBS 223.65]|eukprot:XP_012198863.1 hypothetical protein SPRG_04554 [Saprolegnia parasitica CBS 223.65]